MLNRRTLLTGILVAGFNPVTNAWASDGEAPVDRVPALDGSLRFDGYTQDNGRYITRKPVAVLHPKSTQDIARMIRFCRAHGIKVATTRTPS